MENIEKIEFANENENIIDEFVEKSHSQYRYTVALMFRKEYICDIASVEGADAAEVVRDALQAHFSKIYHDDVKFVLDDRYQPRTISDLLEAVAKKNAPETR